jgi:hypothetical protein
VRQARSEVLEADLTERMAAARDEGARRQVAAEHKARKRIIDDAEAEKVRANN